MNKSRTVSTVRRRASSVALIIGWGVVIFGLLSAFSGFGLPFLLCSPLLFLFGVGLAPSRPRAAQAAFVLACWFVGLGFVLA